MARSSTKKTSRLDKLCTSLIDLHSEMQEHRRKQRAKEHLRKKSHHSHKVTHKHRKESCEDKLIPKPKGRCGRSDGYSLIEAMSLTKQRPLYNALRGIVRKLTIKYLDTSRSLSQQKDRLLVEKIIRKAQIENDILKQYEGGWPVRDMIRQYLSNCSAKERQIFEFLEESSDESGTDSGSESESDTVSRQRRKKISTSHCSQKKKKPAGKTKPAAELFDDSSSENSESEPERTTIKKPIKKVKRKRAQVQTDPDSNSDSESASCSDSNTRSTHHKIMLREKRPTRGKALTARTRKATTSDRDSGPSEDSDHNMKDLERSAKRRRIIRRQASSSSMHDGADQTAKKRSKNPRPFTNLTNTLPTGTGGTAAQTVNVQLARASELSNLPPVVVVILGTQGVELVLYSV